MSTWVVIGCLLEPAVLIYESYMVWQYEYSKNRQNWETTVYSLQLRYRYMFSNTMLVYLMWSLKGIAI